MAAKQSTLFNYFSKSPKTPKTPSTPSSRSRENEEKPTSSENNNTPVRSGAASQNGTPKLKVKKGFCQTPRPTASGFTNGDSVWAKLDGYPWWPAIVCLHPTKKVERLDGKIHVQFFDDPPTRSWIDQRFVKPYKGSQFFGELGFAKPKDSAWDKACREGDKAVDLSTEDRLQLITTLLPSDDEEEEDEDAEMKTPKTPRTPKPPKGSKGSGPQPKRRRIVVEEDSDENVYQSGNDSGDEYKPEPVSESEDETEPSVLEEEDPLTGEEEGESPVSRKRKKPAGKSAAKPVTAAPATPSSSSRLASFATPQRLHQAAHTPSTKSKLAGFAAHDDDGAAAVVAGAEDRQFSHLTYDFLRPENICDAQRRRPDHEDYDPRTLYVPPGFKDKQTPAMRQWWELKARHYDVVLFFKMGKFYELYHTDAIVAVKELGIVLMKGDAAHCGFPERAFAKHSSVLIEKGYKVARIEQTETPEMMEKRVKAKRGATKFDKVVQRELCQITTRGTRTFNVMEGDCTQVDHHFLLAVTEKPAADAGTEFGVAFVDTSIGAFHVGQFADDRYRSRLSTLLTHHNPVEILSEKRCLAPETLQLLQTSCPNALHDFLSSGKEFWDSANTLRYLAEGGYFVPEGEASVQWPEALKSLTDQTSALGLVATEQSDLAVRCLGALCWYLTDCQLDQELLSRRSFHVYTPVDQERSGREAEEPALASRRMVLDGMTLRNLDVLVNSALGTSHATLFERLNRCSTAFGQRLLRYWICAPLCQPEAIEDRLDAVEYLVENPSVAEDLGKILKSLPDLERLVSKIHSQGSSLRARKHPDSRAIFFDDGVYSKKKIQDFLLALDGFSKAREILGVAADSGAADGSKSRLLRQCLVSPADGGRFPQMDQALEFFRTAFDRQEAEKEGKIIPRSGVDPQYDESLRLIREIEADADAYIQEQRKYFGCRVAYVGSDKKRFQLEVPEASAKKADHRYEIQGQRKGFKRYYTAEGRDLIRRLMAAEEQRDSALKDTSRRIFAQFDRRRKLWEDAVGCLAVLDVLVALAAFSRAADQAACRPKIVAGGQPHLRMVEGIHPCHSQLFVSAEFIPNDVHLGCRADGAPSDDSLKLVTGPNMGGKSTLMRQVGLCVILAQMGCYVPAAEFQLTPVDRLFTRLGASDHILGGESTFFVELSETAAILQHATTHSLVLLDELGRGTATFDGTAIAYAVVDDLARRRCRTLFSTHYHSLVHDLSANGRVSMGHMACMVESDDLDDPSQESIIFLYKFVDGSCPKSYGFHAARLAGLPDPIVSAAFRKAQHLQRDMDHLKMFIRLFAAGGSDAQSRHRSLDWTLVS